VAFATGVATATVAAGSFAAVVTATVATGVATVVLACVGTAVETGSVVETRTLVETGTVVETRTEVEAGTDVETGTVVGTVTVGVETVGNRVVIRSAGTPPPRAAPASAPAANPATASTYQALRRSPHILPFTSSDRARRLSSPRRSRHPYNDAEDETGTAGRVSIAEVVLRASVTSRGS
jgi:hypothetical protein